MKATTSLRPACIVSLLLVRGATAAQFPEIESVEVRLPQPAGARVFGINATSSRFHAGLAESPDPTSKYHACLWNRYGDSLVDLHPTGYSHEDGPATKSQINAMDEFQQVGTTSAGNQHAALWSGDASSHIDLHPAGALASFAYAVENGRQAGSVSYAHGTYSQQAAMWSSTPESLVILNPPQAARSQIRTMSEGWQGGWTESGRWRAAAWQGSVESFVDLNPEGWQSSWINGNRGPEMVGWVSNGGSNPNRAARWSGTRESYQSLHPANALWSSATATEGEFQIGVADFGKGACALVWMSEANSYLNLHESLDTNIFVYSYANTIRHEGLRLVVDGRAQRRGLPISAQAVEWIVTLVDHEAPAITSATPYTLENQSKHCHYLDVSFETVIEENSLEADWYIESAAALRSKPSHGRSHGKLKSEVRIVDGKILRIRRENGHKQPALTYTATLRSVDPSGNLSDPYPVSFVLDEP